MLDNKTIDDTFLEIVSELESDEPHICQSSHEVAQNRECLINPVARKHTDCGGKDFLICLNSLMWNSIKIANPGARCAACLRPCGECWSILPI